MTMKNNSPHVDLAEKAIKAYITKRQIISPPDNISEELTQPAASFVCLKKHGDLRGCIGTIQPVHETLAEEIIRNAISAATEDPRFLAVEADELEQLEYSVDVLTSPEKVDDVSDLDPRKYGVIVQSGMKRGLLLPDLEGVDTVEEQIDIASRKAGIHRGEPVTLFRFEVKRYH
jgi:AmmeMemoRadiSam system protein A